MQVERVFGLYFSPTGGVEQIARQATTEIARRLGREPVFVDITGPESRREDYRFGPSDLLVMASPVYAGRLPNKILPPFGEKLTGGGGPALALCVFGNRDYGQAVRELALLLESRGFAPVGAAAFAGRHAFSGKVGENRPDGGDLAEIRGFAARAAAKLADEKPVPLALDHSPLGPYYTPLKEDGSPASFLKARPKTRWERCTRCGLCARTCPMGSIRQDTAEAAGICIKCQACVRRCPAGAKYFDDADFLSHVAMLERDFARRAENRIWL